jgi:hypothetical protein
LKKHLKENHSSAFKERIAKYYDLATLIAEPNFQSVWKVLKAPSLAWKNFKLFYILSLR